MSTPTQETDGCPHGIIRGTGCWKCERAELQSQLAAALAAALARNVELEGIIGKFMRHPDNREIVDFMQRVESLTRQLSESQDSLRISQHDAAQERLRIAKLEGLLSETQAQLKQARSYHHGQCNEFTGKGRCNCWVMSVGEKDAGKYDTRVKELEAQLSSAQGRNRFLEEYTPKTNLDLIEVIKLLNAQLASAREDSERLDWLEEGNDRTRQVYRYLEGFTAVCKDHCHDAPTVRSAIDAARGHLAKTPSGGETGKASTKAEDECPQCGEDLCRDEVDIGVGIQCGPWFCQGCGWSQTRSFEEIIESFEAPIPPPPQGKEQE